MTELTHLSASEMLVQLKSKECSARELIEAHIRRIEAVNPILNALVHTFFDEAMDKAAQADNLRSKRKNVPPLLGVPITIKESIDTAGHASTLGLENWQSKIAVKDAVVCSLLKDAGAIVIGKTNISQMLLFHESDNPIWGPTNNPWDLSRVPGGSSGGEAAAIAAGMSPWGVGTDIGGSIRIPSAFCGVPGLKPTVDRWSNMGSNGVVLGQEVIRSQCGPMARSADDIALLMEVLSADHFAQYDPNVSPGKLPKPSKVKTNKLRIGFYEDDGFIPASDAVKRAVRESIRVFEDLGAEVVPFRPIMVEELLETYLAALSADGGKHMEIALGDGQIMPQLKGLWTIVRLPKVVRRLGTEVLTQLGEHRVERVLRNVRPKDVYELWQLTKRRTEIRREIFQTWNNFKVDAIICPAHATPALKHGQSDDFTLGGSYSMRYNFLNFPAGFVSVTKVKSSEVHRSRTTDRIEKKAGAVDAGSAGLPVGVQVVARPFREDIVLSLMSTLEANLKGDSDYPHLPVSVN
ncbi:MAG: amidase [Myxococcota bacterium]|nr:amidase [Myxococcota bacterium]